MLAQSLPEKHASSTPPPPTLSARAATATDFETGSLRDRGKPEGFHGAGGGMSTSAGPAFRPRGHTAAATLSAPSKLDSLVNSTNNSSSISSNSTNTHHTSSSTSSLPITGGRGGDRDSSPPGSVSSSPTSATAHSSSVPASPTTPHRQRSGSDKDLLSASSPTVRLRRDTVALLASSLGSEGEEDRVAALLQDLPEESKESLRKKSEKLLKKELEKKMKEEERHSKKLKKKEQDDAKLSKKFQLPLEEVQKLINTYRCAFHKTGIIHHGKVYIFPNYICFTSSSGLTTAKIAIAEIQTITLKVINAIQIVTSPPDNPKGKKYYLSHWHHRERAFKAFNALWRHAQGDASICLDDLKDATKLKSLSFDEGKPSHGSMLAVTSTMSMESSADDFSTTEDMQSDFDLRDTQATGAVPAPSTEDDDVVLPPTLENIQYLPPHASKSPDASAVLEVSLKRFWKLFLAEGKFYSDVHLAKGDRVARTGEWSVAEGGFYARPHYFEQDVKSKLMKGKICKVDQTQQACMRSPKQLIFGTDSRMEGVPYATDFTVKTYWEVTEENAQLINIHVWLWVDWIKVPFGLKGTIERGAINGVKEHFESFIGDTRKVLAAKAAETSGGTGSSSGLLPSTADNSATDLVVKTPAPSATATTTGTHSVEGTPNVSAPPINRLPPQPSASQDKGLLDTLFTDPMQACKFGAVLVVLLAFFTYFFFIRASDSVDDLPRLNDDDAQALVSRWQHDLDKINDHLRQVHSIMNKLQREIQQHAKPK